MFRRMFLLLAAPVCGMLLCACATPADEHINNAPPSEGIASSDDKVRNGLQSESNSSSDGHFEVASPTDDQINIVMVGDILLHTPIEEAAANPDGTYNFDFIFENMKDEISAADIAIVNQEVIIGGKELGVSGYPAFNAPAEIGDALVNAGFDVVCHATNHTLDKGKKGVVNTCAYWNTSHPDITVVGINEDDTRYQNIDIITVRNTKIAILNYTYGTNGIPMPSDMPHAVDMLDQGKVVSDLKFAEKNADFTIVCPHWGTEYSLEPDDNQLFWNRVFRQNGADLVLGTHPHVIEPVTFESDPDPKTTNNHGGGDMLTYYSLGNFVNWTSGTGNGTANRMIGGMAQVSLGRDDNGEVIIKDHSIRALVCHVRSGPKGVTVFPLSEYTDELGKESEIVKQDSSFSKSYCVSLCNKVWGAGNWR